MIAENEIEQAIDKLFAEMKFPDNPAGLYDPLRYMIAIGGKRIRPRLCLYAYSLFNDELDEHILEPAAALEVFHSFTLLHDDIMDKSDKRRGEPTVWKKWSPDTAILSGDVMSIDSYRRIAKAPLDVLPLVLSVFTKTAMQVCEGQQYDMDFESEKIIPMSDYMKMIGDKTAVLIACSAKIGAMIGGAAGFEAELLYRYGYDLGLAFQIADDYLDVYADEKVFGKPVGGDIINNKKSWMLTRALEKAENRELIFKATELPISNKAQRDEKIKAFRCIYEELGVPDDAKKEIARLTERALSYVAEIDKNDILKHFADSLVGRAK